MTINQGLGEAGYWQHNAPERPDICLTDKHFGRRKTKCQPDTLLKSFCIVLLQIKETGVFVVGSWRNVRKEAAILCHNILFHIGSH